MHKILILIIFSFSLSAYAGSDAKDIIENNIKRKISNFTADSISSFFNGPGTTEVIFKGVEAKERELSILLVRPFAVSSEDAFFSQIQLNNYYVRNNARFAINIGLGYRKILNDNYLIGANIFLDADDEDNTRSSIGAELKSNTFEAYINYYMSISSSAKVGVNTERVLDGYDFHAIGQVPFVPWAKIHYAYFDWDAEKYSTDTDGTDLSLEMLITKNILLEVGYRDTNATSADGFGSIRFIYPGQEGVSALDEFISVNTFTYGNVEHLLLSKVERQNRIRIETVSEGVVIRRLD